MVSRFATFVVLLSLCLAASFVAAQDNCQEDSYGYLAITYTNTESIDVVDLDARTVSATLNASGKNGGLTTSDDGNFAIVTLSDKVEYLDSGATYDSHGDHVDTCKTKPSKIPFHVNGPVPAHVEGHFGWMIVHFDGSKVNNQNSRVVGVWEDDLRAKPAAPQTIYFDEQGPNHGVAKAMRGCNFLISVPNPDFISGVVTSSLPNGFKIVNAAQQLIYDLNVQTDPDRRCKGYHGSAQLGDHGLFGCLPAPDDGGFLLTSYNEASKTFSSRKIMYPDATSRASTIYSHGAQNFFLANYGAGSYKSLIKVNPAATSLSSADIISFNATLCQFGFERKDGSKILALLTDGTLRVLNAADGVQIHSIQFSSVCGSGVASPLRMAIGDNQVMVAVPSNSTSTSSSYTVQTISLGDYSVNTFSANGNVRALTVFGVPEHHVEFPIEQCSGAVTLVAGGAIMIVFVVAALLMNI